MNNHTATDCNNRRSVSLNGHVDPRLAAQVTPQIVERVKREAVNDRISCIRAHVVAEEFGVTSRIVGIAAELANIRIRNCDLGCF